MMVMPMGLQSNQTHTTVQGQRELGQLIQSKMDVLSIRNLEVIYLLSNDQGF